MSTAATELIGRGMSVWLIADALILAAVNLAERAHGRGMAVRLLRDWLAELEKPGPPAVKH